MPTDLSDPRLQTALNRVNLYRKQAGVAACSLNPALVQSAQAHADYFRQNFPLANPHAEDPGKPGFVGIDFFARTKAAGYINSDSTNENVTNIADPNGAIAAFMTTISHRAVLLDPSYPDIGFGFATTPDGKNATCVIDFGMPVWNEVFEPAWILWPSDNQTSYPLQMPWPELPDPFQGVAHYPIGNPITIQFRGVGEVNYVGNLFALTDMNGKVIPIYPLPKLTMFATRKSAVLASQQPLQPNTTYSVTIGYNQPGHSTQMRTWHFSTGPTLDNGSVLLDKANLTHADVGVRKLWLGADSSVASGSISRSWVYGPRAFDIGSEPYVESPGGQRQVYYFDKGRMEITNPSGDRSSQWFISTGRLVAELVSGQMQMGNTAFQNKGAANVPIAGDILAGNSNAPTYASFAVVASLNNDKRATNRNGQPVMEAINQAGRVQTLATAPAPVTYSNYDNTLGHNIPDVIMKWTTSLPNPWVFVLGLPLSEPYWSRVKVGGVDKDVLIQIFERRAVTYTPSNAAVWQVEMGNVGQHYHTWRYGN